MKELLTMLEVDNLIVHDVPKKSSKNNIKGNPGTPLEETILSDIPTKFDNDLVKFFRDKISSTIGSTRAFEVEFDPSLSENRTQQAIKDYFEIGSTSSFPLSENDVIRITQDIAKSLYEVQNARNPGGILLFIPCHNQDKYGLAVLKVEREDGVRIQRDTTELGKTTFNAQHIKDLMLTKKTKLFKVGLFYKNNGDIIGFVCDQQQGGVGNREVATFFLTDFLGCKLKEEPHVSTKKFYETTIKYINGNNLTDSEKVDVRTHLVSELTNNVPSVNLLDFARRSLPAGKSQGFMDAMEKNNVPQNFTKDIQQIEDKIKKVRYELECGIKITGTEEAVKENLTIEPHDDGKMRFELIDHIMKVE